MTTETFPAGAPADQGAGVRVARSGAVLTITFDRPERRNAVDDAGWQALHEALLQARRDESVRAVVLTGAGDDFCSGADLAGPRRAEHPLTRMRWLGDIATLLHELPKPVVAKVRGVAAGAGCNLALGADFVVAGPTARFSEIFARRGLSLDVGGSWLLPRAVGLLQAKRLALLAEVVDAEEALRIGLVTWVTPAEELDAFVDDLLDRLLRSAPVAVAECKALLDAAASGGFSDAIERESRAQLVNLGTDAPAAREAFLAKTEPAYEGRWRL